ncbi:MAG: S8 family peptidase [Bacteroidia bacterium]
MNKLFTFLLLGWAIQMTAQQANIDPLLWAKVNEKGKAECLVILKGQADLSAAKHLKTKEAKGQFVYQTLTTFAKKSQANLVNYLQTKGIAYRSFWAANVLALTADKNLMQDLAQRQDVLAINENSALYYHKPVEYSKKDKGGIRAVEWGIQMIEADSVWNAGYTGQGIVVGGQDTGYDWEHEALKDKYRGWDGTLADHNYNWHDAIHQADTHHSDTLNPCGFNILVPCDDQEHGTHTMGTMVGLSGNEQIGLAYDAKWVGVRNMERGYGTPTTYIEGFEWFIAPTDLNNANPLTSKAPDVINNSWGCPPTEGCNPSNFSIMEQVVANTRAAGIVVVVSAGNSGPSCHSIEDPAAMFEASFSVGATNWVDTIANFSSRGTVNIDSSNRLKPNISAPGVFIRSCVPGGTYQSMSGTSMAGPHVAGAVALLLSAAPMLKGNVDSVQHILEMTAKPLYTEEGCGNDLPTSLPNNVYGHGRLDIWAAVKFVLANQNTAIETPSENIAHLFPNPTQNSLFIELTDIKDSGTFSLYNVSGQAVLQQEMGAFAQISLAHLPQGMYFAQIKTAKGSFSQRIVKE